jgi:hypothetical protein
VFDVADCASHCEVTLYFAFDNITMAAFNPLFLVSTHWSVLVAELCDLAVFAY